MNWYFKAFRKYAVFTGRANRKEYWFFMLFNAILMVFFEKIETFLNTDIFSLVYALIVIIPALALSVRRLHDINRSGWWLLSMLIPIIGMLPLLIFAMFPSTQGANRFDKVSTNNKISEKNICKIATLSMRYHAFMFDVIFLSLAYFLLSFFIDEFPNMLFLVIIFFYFFISLVLPSSASMGYFIAGLKVVKIDGTQVGVISSFVRFFTSLISMALVFPNFLYYASSKGQSFHDYLSKTTVVDKNYSLDFTIVSMIFQIPFYCILLICYLFLGSPKDIFASSTDKDVFLYRFHKAPCLGKNLIANKEIILFEARGDKIINQALFSVSKNIINTYESYVQYKKIDFSQEKFIQPSTTDTKELKLYDKNETFFIAEYYRCGSKDRVYSFGDKNSCSMYLLKNKDGNVGWKSGYTLNPFTCKLQAGYVVNNDINDSYPKPSQRELVKLAKPKKQFSPNDELFRVSKKYFKKLKSEAEKTYKIEKTR